MHRVKKMTMPHVVWDSKPLYRRKHKNGHILTYSLQFMQLKLSICYEGFLLLMFLILNALQVQVSLMRSNGDMTRRKDPSRVSTRDMILSSRGVA